MKNPLLVLDVHYLMHRAYHSTQELSWKGKLTGAIFGFLKSLTFLKDEFQTDRIAFCFEHPHLFRWDIYPAYKRRRMAKKTEEERKASHHLTIQICELRKRYLPKIGFKNIFCYDGMESDDIMAAIARTSTDEVVLVTADHDLFQCLRSNVMMYSPQARILWTEERFTSEYGIPPWKWAVVKAMAGCSGDEVEGIKGIGESTAIRYLRGELKLSSQAYQAIVSAKNRAIVRRNRALVALPFEGCPVPDLQEDEVDTKGWREVCAELGMRTLAGRPPIATRAGGRR